MILVDLSQIMMASTMMSMEKGQTEADVDFVRHSVLNSLRMYRASYFEEYGELVICCDAPNSWRKEYFPLYKAGRRTGRESSPLNWSQIFDCFTTIKTELKTIFPYKFIQVDTAEADDIIGVLCRYSSQVKEKVLIVSSDKDFIQLHRFTNVKQYSPITKKFINGIDPYEYLTEHILKGDTSDGVPNVLSPDNTFVDGLRQKPVGKKKIAEWTGNILIPAEMALPNEEARRNFQRNEKLIDLSKSPEDIFMSCLDAYKEAPDGDRSKLLNYFIEKRLSNLTESIGDF